MTLLTVISSRYYGGEGEPTHIALLSALLGYPNALHFGTSLRTKKLKTCHRQLLYTLFAPMEFESLPIKIKNIQ